MSSPCLLFLHCGATRRRPPTLVPSAARDSVRLGYRVYLSNI